MSVINQKRKLSRIVSFILAFFMSFSSFANVAFADEPVKHGEWTVINDGTASGTASIDEIGFTYYSPTTEIVTSVYSGKNGVKSRNTNGSASNGIVVTDQKGYCEFPAEKDGTLTVLVANATSKTGYVSRTNRDTGVKEAIASFIPGVAGEGDSTENFEVIQGANWATVNIEVESGYTYYICVSGSKMTCYGAEFTPYTQITGTINDKFNISDYGIKFTNLTTKQVETAEVNTADKTYSIKLKPGYSYSASLTGTSAATYTISSTTRIVTPSGESITANFDIEECVTYNVSGSLSGIADGYNLDDLGMSFVPNDANSFETIVVTLDKSKMTYSATLVAGEEYTLTKEGANDYEFAETIKVSSSDETAVVKDVLFKPVETFEAKGGFIGLTQVRGEYENLNVSPTEVVFTNVDDKYSYKAAISDTGYSINLRKGDYIASIVCENYSTTTHIVVEDKATEKNLLLKFEGKVTVPYSEVIYVGSDKEYKTVQSAVDAAKNMERTDGQRVTIKIDPGTYREQVYVTIPNITLESNGGNRDNTKITWYYGIGYKYYSTVNSLYDPYADYDKYGKGDVVSYWGAVVITSRDATGFNAKNICFENSFNKYMTEEEISDGVEVNGLQAIKVARKENTKVDTRTATERAAALVNYADKTEFLNCSFIGSQDTLYTCNTNYKAYYKNCYIEGQTDYIYGNGDVIFDGCELNWCGYNGTEAGGYITAQSASADHPVIAGYVFRNCIITGNKERSVVAGQFGRMWGAEATVNFINTQLEDPSYLGNEGWSAMTVKPTDDTVKLKEYNTTYNGEKIDTSKRVAGVVDSINPDDYTVDTVFVKNGWTPNYYTTESTETPEIVSGPSFTSNGDLNTPNPGETVTVSYEMNEACANDDTSRISWYAVDINYDPTSLETILKSSTLLYTTASYKTISFQLPMECAGKYFMAVITPITVGGKEGTPKYIVNDEKAVSNTWSNPDNIGEIEPGSGINIYLAGDSTVKDYSTGGDALGSWGEFLQYFFDEDYVKVNNYSQGGRSGRIFVNEGTLEKIRNNISEGDYLFIQFGHNDCANGKAYYEDRFVPLFAQPDGADVVNGIYPTVLPTEDIKVNTPSAYVSKYGDKYYSWDCGATYKGYLQAHIDVALAAGATPVIVTPVARMYYNSDGSIRTHHDATATDYEPTSTYLTSNNAYVTACKQLYDENIEKGNKVCFLDGYKLTEELFLDAWNDCKSNVNGAAMMGSKNGSDIDATHCNKVGGVIEAGIFAKWIQDANLSISQYVVQPTTVYGENPDGEYIFTIKNKIFKALNNVYEDNAYATNYGQTLFDSIGGNSSAKTYSISGKTNVTSGTIDLLDSSDRKIASTTVNADGTYTFMFNSSLEALENIYKIKIEGYKTTNLQITVSAENSLAYSAADVTLEEEIIVNEVSLDFSTVESLELYETNAETTFKNGIYSGVYTNGDMSLAAAVYRVSIMYYNGQAQYGTKMETATPLFSFEVDEPGMYTLTVTPANTGSATVDLYKNCSDVTAKGSCSDSVASIAVSGSAPTELVYKKTTSEKETLYFSASAVSNFYVKGVSIKKEALPDDVKIIVKGNVSGFESDEVAEDIKMTFKCATETKNITVAEYEKEGIELIVGQSYNITAVGKKGYYQGVSLVVDESGKSDLAFSRIIFEFPLELSDNFADISEYLIAMGYNTGDVTDSYSKITVHANGMVMYSESYGAKTNANDFITFEAEENGICKVSVDITASNTDTIQLKVNGEAVSEPTEANAGTTVLLSAEVKKGDKVTLSTPTRSNLYYKRVDVSYEAKTVETYPVGDVDADGKISVNDASILLQKVLDTASELPIENKVEDYMENADVNKDGTITAIDVAMILRKALDSQFEF